MSETAQPQETSPVAETPAVQPGQAPAAPAPAADLAVGPGPAPQAPAPAAPAPEAPPALTEEQKAALDALCKQAIEYVDAFLTGVGIKDIPAITDEAGWRYLQLGTAEGRAGVVRDETGAYLRAESPVMPLPSDKDLILPLMRELLEMNLVIVGPVRFGMRADSIFASLQYPVAGLDQDMVARCIHSVMSVADGIDEKLGEKYGGTSLPRQS
jgi:hypothetical protein